MSLTSSLYGLSLERQDDGQMPQINLPLSKEIQKSKNTVPLLNSKHLRDLKACGY